MNQDIITFLDSCTNNKRLIAVDLLKSHAQTCPMIDVKVHSLAEQTHDIVVDIPESAQNCNYIAVYQYMDKNYVLLGSKMLQEMLERSKANPNASFKARMITKHAVKKSEPPQIDVAKVVSDTGTSNRYNQRNFDNRDDRARPHRRDSHY